MFRRPIVSISGRNGDAVQRTDSAVPIACSRRTPVSSFLSVLSLMLVLPGLAAAAAYVAVAVSLWLESRPNSGQSGGTSRCGPGEAVPLS